jgi:putative nucleotidyltransferase with HDIG domain
MNVERYEDWTVAPEDVIAEVPFEVPKSPEELARDQALAIESVPPTYDLDVTAADTMVSHLEAFFDAVDAAATSGDRAALEGVLQVASILASESQMLRLMDPANRATLRTLATRAASQILPRGVADASQVLEITTPTVTVRRRGEERSLPAEEFLTSRDFFEEAMRMLPSSAPPDIADLLRLILIRNIEYTYVLDVIATELDHDAAAQSVPTVKASVLQGEAIVRAADPIDEFDLERLTAYEAELRNRGLLEERSRRLGPTLGALLENLSLLAIFALLIFFTRPEVYGNFRWLLLISLLVASYFGAAAAIAGNGLGAEWLPISFVALPVAILWDTRMALVLVLVLAAVTGALAGFAGQGTVVLVMAGGAAAAMSVRAVRRRSETWVSIAIISAATGMILLADGLMTGQDAADILEGALKATANATVAALLATGFLFVFEVFTGITTDQTLLEWADPTRPLLKRLSLEAPGTYAHTINVANLAEAASNTIGANGLLSRVGVYYHDVGKMLKPHYFVENQPDGRNPHDLLKPATSAAIVREHVTEGVRLAREAKVPEVVTRFILEHHGTQRIGFFYEKALEEAEGELDAGDFAYPGPKPDSKESAIVMLADSCESATRALKDPTSERVADLIQNIIDSKIAAGQLDDAPLTLKEITEVKKQFVKILSGVVHRRIDYPATKHLTDAAAEPEAEVDPSGAVEQAEEGDADGSGEQAAQGDADGAGEPR